MRIEFIPDGGFNKTGGFIEYDNDGNSKGIVYERGGHIDVEMICTGLHLEHEVLSSLDPESKIRRRISGIGEFQPATWGHWRLSLLGSSNEHEKVQISIHDAHEERVLVRAAGHRGSDRDDIDIQFEEGFYVDIVLATSRFEKLLEQLREPSAKLFMRVQFGGIPRFLAAWSPSISEGRTIKFLDRTSDVSNSADIPEDFFTRRSQDDDFEDPIKASVRVYNRLGLCRTSGESHNDVRNPPVTEEYDPERLAQSEKRLAQSESSQKPHSELKPDISQLVQSVHKLRGSFRLWMILLVLAILWTGTN